MSPKPGPREVVIAVGLALVGAGVSRWTLSRADQHDEVPTACALVIDGSVLAWILLTSAGWRTARRRR